MCNTPSKRSRPTSFKQQREQNPKEHKGDQRFNQEIKEWISGDLDCITFHLIRISLGNRMEVGALNLEAIFEFQGQGLRK